MTYVLQSVHVISNEVQKGYPTVSVSLKSSTVCPIFHLIQTSNKILIYSNN